LYRSWIIDGKIEMANDRMAEMFGYNNSEECIAKYIAIEHYEYPDMRDELVGMIREHGEVKNFEAPIRKDDGSIIWVQFSGTISSDKQFFEGVATDITERKRSEEALGDSEKKFRTLVEELPLAISLIDSEGHYKYVNPAFTGTFGYTLEDVSTGREWFRKAYPNKTYRSQVLRSWIEGKDKAYLGQSIPRIYTPDGHFKIPHLWPGQNTPPEVRFHPWRESGLSLQILG
jgi:PAS domain S-box-containing protein